MTRTALLESIAVALFPLSLVIAWVVTL